MTRVKLPETALFIIEPLPQGSVVFCESSDHQKPTEATHAISIAGVSNKVFVCGEHAEGLGCLDGAEVSITRLAIN